ncbi:Rap1a/Tai family immunity protein [Planktotalea arctica]|uniref:Rap1a/Tai family immunity protein n=1 Tax=Planktotalea arctica TaxID=1481893 RepID=UPI00111C3360|nr:Rap1a/Tai family immunity protein [Planktotalea arctica]
MIYKLCKAFTLAAILLSPPSPLTAQNASGNEIFAACSSEKIFEQTFCLGHIIGSWEGITLGASLVQMQASDGNGTAQEATEFARKALDICFPDNLANKQVTDIVMNYMRTHPQSRHHSARMLVWLSMGEAFPCE